MTLFSRFLTSYRGADLGVSEEPGLVQNDDGTVDVIRPDGTRGRVGNGGGSSVIQTATVTLIDEQIKALPTAPVEIVAPQGENTVILLKDVVLQRNFAVGYTNADSDFAYLTVVLGDDDLEGLEKVQNVGGFLTLAGFLDVGGGFEWLRYQTPQPGGNLFVSGEPFGVNCINAAAKLYLENNGHGRLTAGDAANTLTVYVYYMILALG